MRDIDLSAASDRTTVMSYGPTRSGKTQWAATWPRPLFLADATEGGWTTVRNMDPEWLYEPGRRPKVWAIEKPADMMQAISKIDPLVKSGEVLTVVVDPLTFYADLFVSAIESQTAQGGKTNAYDVYGKLKEHLRYLRIQVQSLQCNVIWICHEKTPDAETPMGLPLLPGKDNGMKFAATCDYVLYHRQSRVNLQTPPYWEIRTRTYNNYLAGGRDGGILPDPLGYAIPTEDGKSENFTIDCTYRTFASVLGLAEPKIATATTVAAAAKKTTK